MKKLSLFLLISIMLISCKSLFAADYYVDANIGSDTTGDGSSGNPWKTITFALTQVGGSASDPEVINIAAGIYDLALGENFPITISSYISLKGESRDATVLDATGASASVLYAQDESNISLENLTLTGSTGTEGIGGGGILMIDSSISANDISITGNLVYYGSGIFCYGNSTLTINNSLVNDNDGIGIYILSKSNFIINNTEISNNNGDGICGNALTIDADNCIFKNNKSIGLYFYTDLDMNITNCEFYENQGGGIEIRGNIAWFADDMIYNNKQFGISLFDCENTYIDYCDIINNDGNGLNLSGCANNINISDSLISGNYGSSGGGFYIMESVILRLKIVLFRVILQLAQEEEFIMIKMDIQIYIIVQFLTTVLMLVEVYLYQVNHLLQILIIAQ